MNTNKKTAGMEDMKVKLSILWAFVMFNMLAADILSFMIPESMKELITTGNAGGIHITQGFLLVAAILMEIPIIMIFLSRVLKYRANRWANIIAGIITIAFVIGGGASYLHYLFIATMEVVAMLLIIWYAWKWSPQEA
jgi:uncharacterized protein DUF6326